MPNIIPFRGIRPTKDKAHLVASRSVDGYDPQGLHQKLASNPYTFLHVINPDFSDGVKTTPGSEARLQKIKKKYQSFLSSGILVQDTEPAFYVYQQVKDGHTFTGIIGCTSVEDYEKGVIKIHEQTLTDREEKLMHYLEVCDFNVEPVLFSYPNNRSIDDLTKKIISTEPEFDFTTTDTIEHKLWVVNKKTDTDAIVNYFKTIPSIYIADGHHRSASSALLGKSRKSKNSNHTGKEAYNYYLGVFFPESELKIYDFNRTVKDLNGLSANTFIQKISEKFDVVSVNEEIFTPTQKHNLGLYLEGKWYSLTAKSLIVDDSNPVGSLDAAILTDHILSPILGIHDLKTDKRVGFVPGIKGVKELKRQVDVGQAKASFALYPVSMEQLKRIADTNNIMPPKSTWVEPKMRSGMVIYSLTE